MNLIAIVSRLIKKKSIFSLHETENLKSAKKKYFCNSIHPMKPLTNTEQVISVCHPIRSDQLCSYKDVTADTNILMLFCCLLSLSHLSERAVQEMRRQGLSFSTLQTSSSLSVSSSSHHISPERSILRSLDHSTDKSADR